MIGATIQKGITERFEVKDPRFIIAALVVLVEAMAGFLALVAGWHVLFVMVGAFLTLVIVLNPKIGALMMLFFLPGYQYLSFDVGTVTMTALRFLLIPTLIGLVVQMVVYKRSIRIGGVGIPVLVLLAIAVFSIMGSSNVRVGLVKLVFLVSLFAITFVLAHLLDDEKWIKIAIGTMLASSLILIILILGEAYFVYKGVIATVTGGHRLAAGASGMLYRTPHPLTMDLNTFLPFVLILAAGPTHWKSIFLMLLASGFLLGIVLAAAMAGWLATIGCLTVLAVVGLARKRGEAVKGIFKKLIPVIVLGALLVPVAVPMGLLGERVKRFASIVTLTDIRTQRTSEVRIPVWVAAQKMFHDHPILGVGLGAMPVEYHKYMVAKVGQPGKEFTHHGFNVFVDIGTEMGILGLGAFIWFMTAFGWQVFKYLRVIKDPFLANMLLACSAACVAVFIQMQTETGPFWANNFWCLVGLSLAIINVAKSRALRHQQTRLGRHCSP